MRALPLLLAASLLGAAEPQPGWTREAPRTFDAENLYGHIDGGAELFLEYGFKRLTVEYHRRDDRELTLEHYRMDSPEAALGIYLSRCGRETPVPGLNARHTGSATQITALKGRSLVVVLNPKGDAALLPGMVALANRELAGVPEEKPADLFAALPRENRLPGTECLIRGPYGLQPLFTLGEGDPLRLGGRNFAAGADYREAAGEASTRLLVSYPDGATAAAVFAGLPAQLDPTLKVLWQRDSALAFRDFQGKFGSVSLRGRTLELAFHLPAPPAPPSVRPSPAGAEGHPGS